MSAIFKPRSEASHWYYQLHPCRDGYGDGCDHAQNAANPIQPSSSIARWRQANSSQGQSVKPVMLPRLRLGGRLPDTTRLGIEKTRNLTGERSGNIIPKTRRGSGRLTPSGGLRISTECVQWRPLGSECFVKTIQFSGSSATPGDASQGRYPSSSKESQQEPRMLLGVITPTSKTTLNRSSGMGCHGITTGSSGTLTTSGQSVHSTSR